MLHLTVVLTNLNNPILFSRTCLLILAQLAKQNNIQILYLLGYIKFFTRFDCTKKCVNLTFCELGSHKISPISAETPVNRLVVRKCQDDVLKCQNIQFICHSEIRKYSHLRCCNQRIFFKTLLNSIIGYQKIVSNNSAVNN